MIIMYYHCKVLPKCLYSKFDHLDLIYIKFTKGSPDYIDHIM